MTVTFSLALLTSATAKEGTGEREALGEGLEAVEEEDGVEGLAAVVLMGPAGDLRERSGDTEGLWEERV